MKNKLTVLGGGGGGVGLGAKTVKGVKEYSVDLIV